MSYPKPLDSCHRKAATDMDNFQFHRPKFSCQHLLVILKTPANGAVVAKIVATLQAATNSAILILNEVEFSEEFDEESGFPGINRELRSIVNDYQIKLGIKDHGVSILGVGKTAETATIIALKMNYGMAIMLQPSFQDPNVSDLKNSIKSRMLESAVSNYENSFANITLISSPSNKYNYLNKLNSYKHIICENDKLNSIQKMELWAIPLISSYVGLQSYGLTVSQGRAIGREAATPKNAQSGECVAGVRKTTTVGNRINFTGYGILDGDKATRYGDQKIWVEFENQDYLYRSVVGAVPDPLTSIENWHERFVDYSISGFSSFGHLGLDLEMLPHGSYTMGVSVETKQALKKTETIISANCTQVWGNDNALYVYAAENSMSRLSKYPVVEDGHGQRSFSLSKHEITDGRLFIEGQFAVQGQAMPDWSSGHYMLSLQGPVTRSYPLAKLNGSDQENLFGSDRLNYSKSFYSTQNREGLLLEQDLPDGEYSLFIHFIHSEILYTQKCAFKLVIQRKTVDHIVISGSELTKHALNYSLVTSSYCDMTQMSEFNNSIVVETTENDCAFGLSELAGRSFGLFDPTSYLKYSNDENLDEGKRQIFIFDLLPSAIYLIASAGMPCKTLSQALKVEPCNVNHQTGSKQFSVETLDRYLASYASNLLPIPEQHFSKNPPILHCVQLPKEYEIDGERYFFDTRTINIINETLDKLHKIFEDKYAFISIKAYKNGMRAKRKESMGSPGSPFVYESNYYDGFSRMLSKSLKAPTYYSIR